MKVASEVRTWKGASMSISLLRSYSNVAANLWNIWFTIIHVEAR